MLLEVRRVAGTGMNWLEKAIKEWSGVMKRFYILSGVTVTKIHAFLETPQAAFKLYTFHLFLYTWKILLRNASFFPCMRTCSSWTKNFKPWHKRNTMSENPVHRNEIDEYLISLFRAREHRPSGPYKEMLTAGKVTHYCPAENTDLLKFCEALVYRSYIWYLR